MKLSVLERLMLLNILPKENDITTLRIIHKLKDDFSFSEEEHKLLNFRYIEDKLEWDQNIPEKEVEIGEKATDIIVDTLKKLSNQKKLHIDQMSLYDRFINTP